MAGKKEIPGYVQFIIGGLCGMTAQMCVQPLEIAKNRLQMASGKEKLSMTGIFRHVVKSEGFFALYTGLSAGLTRQLTYTSTRMGIFNYLLDIYTIDGVGPSFGMKSAFGVVAGLCGAVVGTPADVCLIRMTTDSRLPLKERRNYKNVVDALMRIVKEEGVPALWRGVIPTMGRAVVVTCSQLVSYSESKDILKRQGVEEGLFLHFGAAMISGVITSLASLPVDILKTRIQSMKYINGKPEYTGMGDVFVKICKNEGVFSLWKGLIPYYTRIGPATLVVFVVQEKLMTLYKTYFW